MSIQLHNLKPAKGSVSSRKRIGRGPGSGRGGTSTRGHKGAQSRSGYSRKIGFEGGQMPLQRRIPKFGFKNRNRVEYRGINLDVLQKLVDENKIENNEVSLQTLIRNGLAQKKDMIKILGRGELKAKLLVSANKFTKNAERAIVKLGGEAIEV